MLCAPGTYKGPQPILATCLLPSGQVFSIQQLSIDNNLEELFDQFLQRSILHWDVRGLLESFTESFQYMAGSHTSQAFIASIDQEHVFEIEIHLAAAHPALVEGLQTSSGDYVIQISAGTWNKTNHSLYAASIACCLAYFTRFAEVKQIFIDCGTDAHLPIEPVIGAAGFAVCRGHLYLYENQGSE